MNIGITIRFNKGTSFQSNGMFQNLFFLADALNTIDGWNCYFLYESNCTPNLILPPDKCISLNEFIQKTPFIFQVIVLGGFSSEIFSEPIFASTKLIAMHCGATMIDDIFKSLQDTTHKKIVSSIKVDKVWTMPQHHANKGYLSAINGDTEVEIMPYIWDSRFIDIQLNEYGFKDHEHFINESSAKSIDTVNIYEPNNTILKTSMLPLAIAATHRRQGLHKLRRCNVLCAKKILTNGYFQACLARLGIKSEIDYFDFYGRAKFIASLVKLGLKPIILSHQIMCELNYLYLEALYLGLPLIHNSNMLSKYGYFYPDSDVKYAASLIDKVLGTHCGKYQSSKSDITALLQSFAPKNPINLSKYESSILSLISN